MTRDDHLAWAKRRALAYLPASPQEAITSMLSDLGKHDELKGIAQSMGMLAIMVISQSSISDVRRFIEGFN